MLLIHNLAPRLQTVDITSLAQLFPVLGWGGVALGAFAWIWGQIWPYFRDTHLPARNKALQDQAQAMKDIGALVSTIAQEQAEIRRDIANSQASNQQALTRLEQDVNEMRLDIAILMDRRNAQERAHGAD